MIRFSYFRCHIKYGSASFSCSKHEPYFIMLPNEEIVCLQFTPMNMSLWKTAPRASSDRSWKQTRHSPERMLSTFWFCLQGWSLGSGHMAAFKTLPASLSAGCILLICFWLLKALFKFDYHLNPLQLVIRHTFITVKKSSSHKRIIFPIRIINKLELETFPNCWKQQIVCIRVFFF